jgi:hypothetical protein
MGVTKKSWVDHSQFQIVWQQIVRLGLENLLTEILAWKEVYFSDPRFFSCNWGHRGSYFCYTTHP